MTPPVKSRKVRAYHYGRLAERLAALVLRLKGYRILDRRYRSSAGEIDLVTKRGNLIAFVEVKARTGHSGTGIAETLGRQQRRRIERTAAAWLAAHPGSETCDVRFDLVAVGPGFLLHHLPGAWLVRD